MNTAEKPIRLFDNIPNGHEAPLPYPKSGKTRRRLESAIDFANHSGDCIIDVGNGYYRPMPEDPIDAMEFKEYLAMELFRANDILNKCKSMQDAYNNKIQDYIQAWKSENSQGLLEQDCASRVIDGEFIEIPNNDV